ncbi:MAG: sterol desaturase family protein [Ferruginibacter sp.]
MKINFLAFAVPLFVGLMLLEYYLSGKKRSQIFHFEEAISNLNIGIAERVTDLFSTGLFYFFFKWLYDHFAIFNITPSWITWIALFLATDFVWYWYHRAGHTVNLFWSAHVVHHQSDDYNYTTSVRITFFQSVARSLFWSILPILGFPPGMITLFLLIHGAYPFFTHTQVIGKLGVLELFMVTPSHHRVHHSSNEEYLDKNYGDILIIWDKLFGTFVKETTTPQYGLTKPLNSYSVLWQFFHFQLEMLYAFKRAKGFKAKWKVIFGKPDDIDPRIRMVLEKRFNIHQRPIFWQIHNRFILVQSIATLVFLFFVILFEPHQTLLQLAVAGLFIIISIINTGALMEQRRWIFYLEYIRLFLLSVFIGTLFPNQFTISCLLALNLMLIIFYKTVSERYYNWLYHYR